MFCSGCGQPLETGQNFCSKCGKPAIPAAASMPAAPMAPPVPGFDALLRGYAGKVRVLAVFWFVYAALSLLGGFAGMTFLRGFLSGGYGPWMHGNMPPAWVFPAVMHLAWVAIGIRAVLAALAGWGLMKHARWGRILAIIVGALALIRFPIGTALGIATLVILLGYRNSALYEQL